MRADLHANKKGESHMQRIIILTFCSLLFACSDNNAPPAPTENVFQTQIDALEKAKEVEQLMLDSLEKQRQVIEDIG